MAYCIMRVEKRERSAVYGLQIEANRMPGDGREFDRSDIDPSRTEDNIFLKKTERWNDEITRQIQEANLKARKGAIVLLDAVYTASPEWFETHPKEEWLDYFRDCVDFHVKTYCAGDPSRLLNAVIHLDEATPHMQVASVPIFQDAKGMHLSAKVVMGNREDYVKRQDEFYENVGSKYGLERGERNDPANLKAHLTKREWQIATQEERLRSASDAADLAEQKEKEALEAEQVANEARIRSEKAAQEAEERTRKMIEDAQNAEDAAKDKLENAEKEASAIKKSAQVEAAEIKRRSGELDREMRARAETFEESARNAQQYTRFRGPNGTEEPEDLGAVRTDVKKKVQDVSGRNRTAKLLLTPQELDVVWDALNRIGGLELQNDNMAKNYGATQDQSRATQKALEKRLEKAEQSERIMRERLYEIEHPRDPDSGVSGYRDERRRQSVNHPRRNDDRDR